MVSKEVQLLSNLYTEKVAAEEFEAKTGIRLLPADYFDYTFPPKTIAWSIYRHEFFQKKYPYNRLPDGGKRRNYILPFCRFGGAWFGYYLNTDRIQNFRQYFRAFHWKNFDEMTDKELEVAMSFCNKKYDMYKALTLANEY
jgi:hypothetical protein